MKIRYIFPKGHAVAYTINAMKIAWWKINYPSSFTAAWLTTKGDQFDISSFTKSSEELKAQIGQAKREIQTNRTDSDVKKKLLKSLNIQYDALMSGVTFKEVSLTESSATQFEVNVQRQVIPPLTTISGLGTDVAKTILETFKTEPEHANAMYQKKLAQANMAENKKTIKRIVFESLLTRFISQFGNKETYATHFNKAFTKCFNKTYENNLGLDEKELVNIFREQIATELVEK